MGYKIAVATSDGIHIDLHFGQTDTFTIYEVSEDRSYRQTEHRKVGEARPQVYAGQSGCGGCGGRSRNERIAVIEDCRAVLCARCGAGTQTELGKKRITSFVIEKPVREALNKIVDYYGKSTHSNVPLSS